MSFDLHRFQVYVLERSYSKVFLSECLFLHMRKRILFTILNWGLGHASRSIPIIRAFTTKKVEVIIGSSGEALEMLREEFPALELISFPDYGIRYPFRNMLTNMLYQGPAVGKALIREYFLLQRLIRKRDIHGLITDSRFGCYSSGTPSVFITHQINLQSPNPIFSYPVNLANSWFISRHEQCWVPDFPGKYNLSGKLSRPTSISVKYIGPQSRFNSVETPKIYQAVAVLSGPEPQRTILEKILIKQLSGLPGKYLLIRGKPKLPNTSETIGRNLEMLSFLGGKELNLAIQSADAVICRAGYSSIMDLSAVRQKALLIPTPGQTEQEYLARHLAESPGFVFQEQTAMNVRKALDLLRKSPVPQLPPLRDTELLDRAVTGFLDQINP